MFRILAAIYQFRHLDFKHSFLFFALRIVLLAHFLDLTKYCCFHRSARIFAELIYNANQMAVSVEIYW